MVTLREKLLAAGLVSEVAAKRAEHEEKRMRAEREHLQRVAGGSKRAVLRAYMDAARERLRAGVSCADLVVEYRRHGLGPEAWSKRAAAVK